MQTYATPVYRKNKADITNNKSKPTTFFSPVKVQPKLTIGAVDDPYEREADAMADRVMRMPAPGMQQTFFKPAPPVIQRQDDATKTLTEGAGVVKDQLEDKPGFSDWKDKQTDALKKKVWDDQPTELKAGIIGFGLSSAGILGTAFATDPRFRADTIKLLDDKNIALPLSLIPYHEYFPLSSFKYKLPSTSSAPLSLSAEFEFKPYLDRMHEKWSFIPKTDLTLGVDTNYSKSGGFGFKGGSIKLKFGGGIFNFTGILNQSLPATPMLVSGNDPGESPMWIMRSLPGQFDDQLPKGYGVFFSVDVARVPELWKDEKRKPDIHRKCAKCDEEEKLQRKEVPAQSGAIGSPQIEQTLQSAGTKMDPSTQSFMEQRFGYDFGNVKIHTNPEAAKSADSINALAYTSGNNIVFNQDQFSPGTESGKKLLAHELTHVVQQGSMIRRTPKDAFGRPLGFVSTPEQQAYDKDTAEIKEWNKVLERLGKGELDDRDMANARLRNRLTGLTTTDINSLISKIQVYQNQNPSLSTSKIIEWLEVRKEISTPMPDGATVNKDPITNTIDSYSLTLGNVQVKVLADSSGNKLNDTGPVSSFGRSYRWTAKRNIINGLFDRDSGSDVAVNPTSFAVTIQTRYHDNPNASSAYGKGTQVYDKEEKTTTLRAHEGKHSSDYLDFIRNHPFPVDISNGVVGVLTVAQMRKIDAYITAMTKESCEATDEVGFTQDEFLLTAQGQRSGITSCRR